MTDSTARAEPITASTTPDPCASCTLADARAGQQFVVTCVGDPGARITALRFGMAEGACVHCTARIPAGPIVLRSGRSRSDASWPR
jgi:antitoxin (DNA-binding transcriptional repressor) of toxin-antitoxin stability system